MANLLERVKQMKNENYQKEQGLEIYHCQHSYQHWSFSSSSQKGVAEWLACLLSSQMSEDDKEEDRLTKNARDYWLEIPKLWGRENYWTWWIQIENDANILKALSVILEQSGQVDRCWEICNQLLVKCMISSMILEVVLEMQTKHFQSVYKIVSYLNSMYTTSQVKKWMILHKTMLNLILQSNHTAMMRQWKFIIKTMKSKEYTSQEIYHDIGIILIVDWQWAYVRI